jgi:tetratricopeptide (TPR) repeat protein
VVLPFLILAGAELVLRAFDWGGYPPFLRAAGKLASGETLCLVEPAASRPYFFANPDRPGYADETHFVMPKPPGTVRIFLFGESAAQGFPQPRNLGMASFLEAMLADVWPGRRVEVINLGTTAIASFPLVYQVRDALRYSPDLLVFYTGNNEFFGAYGTASLNAAGQLPPAALRVMRTVRGLALTQALGSVLRSKAPATRSLMEQMMGRTVVPADSPLRTAAGRNLEAHLSEMLALAEKAGVPAVVCPTACNESGLAPLGEDVTSNLIPARRAELQRLLSHGATGTTNALTALQAATALAPQHARARFLLARALAAAGDTTNAAAAFRAARDLDTLPWRPTTDVENACRRAAAAHGAVLADVPQRFRAASPTGSPGWEWLDDHVHLTVRGHALAARCMVEAMTNLPAAVRVDPVAVAGLPDDAAWARRLGTNPYDDYRVHHTLRVLFGISFMKESNPDVLLRLNDLCRQAETNASPGVRAALEQWQTSAPQAGGVRPVTAMVARALLREGKVSDALPLFSVARAQVPDYTSWYLDYVYFTLACREKVSGQLTDTDRTEALAAIRQGQFLVTHGDAETGLTQRHMGRLHQIRGEWAEAIPLLQAARPRMNAEDLVICDQALVQSYLRTGRQAEALALVDDGIRNSGRFSGIYRQLRSEITGAR